MIYFGAKFVTYIISPQICLSVRPSCSSGKNRKIEKTISRLFFSIFFSNFSYLTKKIGEKISMHWKPNFVIFFAIKDSMCKSFVDNIRILCWVQSHHRNRVFHVEFFICCLLSNKLCLKKQGCRLQNRCRFCLFSLRWLSLNFSFCFTVAGIEGPRDTRSRWRPWPLVPTRTSSRCRRSNRRLCQ